MACEYWMPRSSQSDRMALETSSEIGIGLPIGVTRVIVHASRTPRRVSRSWSMNAVS